MTPTTKLTTFISTLSNSSQSPDSPLSQLPDEMLLRILRYLDEMSRVKFSSTSRFNRKTVWLDPKLLAPILIRAPSLLPFASENSSCCSFLMEPNYTKTILNARHFNVAMTAISTLEDQNDIDVSLGDACAFYAKTDPKMALLHARKIKNPQYKMLAFTDVALFLKPHRKVQVLNDAYECALQMQQGGENNHTLSSTIFKLENHDPQLALKFARLMKDSVSRADSLTSLAKKMEAPLKIEVLEEALNVIDFSNDPPYTKIWQIYKIAKFLVKEKAIECCKKMIFYAEEVTDRNQKDLSYCSIVDILAPLDYNWALSLIPQIEFGQNQIVALCDIAKETFSRDYDKAMELIDDAYARALQIEISTIKSKALYDIAVTLIEWMPNRAKTIFLDAIELELKNTNETQKFARLVDICEQLSLIDLEFAIVTAFRYIVHIHYYSLTLYRIGKLHPNLEKIFFEDIFQGVIDLKSTWAYDRNYELLNFSTFALHDLSLAKKAVENIQHPIIQGKGYFNLSRVILPNSPLEAIHLAEAGFNAIRQSSYVRDMVNALGCFVKDEE